MKPLLSFYTNIPTPYQLDFFEALAQEFDLTVIYYSVSEPNRDWNLPLNSEHYKTIILKNSLLIKPFLKFDYSFHFSRKIINILKNDKAENIVVSGSYYCLNSILVLFWKKNKNVFFFSEKLKITKNILKKSFKQLLLFPLKKVKPTLLAIGGIKCAATFKYFGLKLPYIDFHYSIDSSLYSIDNLDKQLLENLKHTLPDSDKIVILTSAALIERKGVDIAINAFKALPIQIKSKVTLWILGTGLAEIKLKNSLSTNDALHFLGFQEKNRLPYYFNLAQIFLFCSRYDGWGLVINEAIASSLPIITNKNVGASQLIINGVNGTVLNSNKAELYTQEIIKLVENYNIIKQIQMNNKILSTKITSSKMAQKLRNLCP